MAHANTDVITHIQDLNAGFFRQLLCQGTSTPWEEAVDALTPSIGFIGSPCKPTDTEVDTRGEVTALAASPRSQWCKALLGPNEPNDTSYPWGGADNAVKHQFWIWDQAHTVAWPHRSGGLPPPVYTGALRRNFSGALDPNGHRYDEDIAAYANTTYTPPGGSPHKLTTWVDGIDHHQYDGESGSGTRVNGKDSFGNVPPSLVLGSDGKCSRADFEIALAQQLAPSKPVKARTEFGWEDQTGNAQHALYAQETFLRLYQRGVMGSIYETVDEGPSNPNGSGNWFGLYNLTTGHKPIYDKLKTLWTYGGSASFSGVGWVEPLAGVLPDCGVQVFSKAGGGWDVYILKEAVDAVDFVTGPTHKVTGKTPTSTDSWGNKHYSTTLTSTMTVLAVT